ncbi:MAG: hypothetical protein J0H32_03910 [Rhizobiales bacterium]|nr:hypothetical protein [Hyphomicrobiales bacterium]
MTRIGKAMLGAAVAAVIGFGIGGGSATAAGRTVPHAGTAGQAAAPAATDLSAQRRAHRRAPTRIRVYPRHQRLGPNAVRDCTATYVQEFRPSGTVIVPRMHCHWRQG